MSRQQTAATFTGLFCCFACIFLLIYLVLLLVDITDTLLLDIFTALFILGWLCCCISLDKSEPQERPSIVPKLIAKEIVDRNRIYVQNV